MDDVAMFEMLAKYAERLNTAPVEVIRLFMEVGLLPGVFIGAMGLFALNLLLDRVFSGIAHLFRWLRSRRKKP